MFGIVAKYFDLLKSGCHFQAQVRDCDLPNPIREEEATQDKPISGRGESDQAAVTEAAVTENGDQVDSSQVCWNFTFKLVINDVAKELSSQFPWLKWYDL